MHSLSLSPDTKHSMPISIFLMNMVKQQSDYLKSQVHSCYDSFPFCEASEITEQKRMWKLFSSSNLYLVPPSDCYLKTSNTSQNCASLGTVGDKGF